MLMLYIENISTEVDITLLICSRVTGCLVRRIRSLGGLDSCFTHYQQSDYEELITFLDLVL